MKSFPKGLDVGTAKSEGLRELFDIPSSELPLKTNTPPKLIEPFTMIETVEKAFILTRKRRISSIYREVHDRRMIGKSGRTLRFARGITYLPLTY